MIIGPVEGKLFHVDGETSELTDTFAILWTHLKVYRLFYRDHFNMSRALKGTVRNWKKNTANIYTVAVWEVRYYCLLVSVIYRLCPSLRHIHRITAKATVSFAIYICPSVTNILTPTRRIFVKFYVWLPRIGDVQFSLKWEKIKALYTKTYIGLHF